MSALRIADRKASFKSPPVYLSDPRASQEARRKKALEEQKRRRAERFDSSRQLDSFAALNLGPSDDEEEEYDAYAPPKSPEIVHEGVAPFASMLVPATTSTSAPETPAVTSELIPPEQESDLQTIGKKRGKKRKGKARGGKPRSTPQKPSKWADRCMYAELLEMPDESETFHGDGVPDDLETGWVALAPVPTGKRCLAVTHATAGIAGVVPNTTIRSRVLGKPLLKPFPSSLPPNTVLDCILDENWRFNGIVHVLDVLTWKGQDIADCETPFRLWWRDTRLSELPSFPPSFEATTTQPSSSSETSQFQFAHPVTFMPIPYHTNISLSRFVNELIPLTRVSRHLPVQIPITNPSSGMDLDIPSTELQTVSVEVKSDGILLYVSQATYEPGTSPLSTWIPIRAYTEWKDKDKMEDTTEGPLDKFERLIRKRLSRSPGHHASEPVEIEMN